MKILVLGDSFCEYSGENTWPYFLKNKLNAELDCIGVGGASNYNMLTNFKKIYNSDYNYIIVVLTNTARIPVVSQGPGYLSNWMPWHPLWRSKKSATIIPDKFEDAVELYLKFFFDDTFSKWISTQVMNEILSTVKPHQKTIVVRGVYEDNESFNLLKNCIKIRGKLMDFSYKEITEWCKTKWTAWQDAGIVDARLNHFTAINQEALANYLKYIIDQDTNNTLDDHMLDLHNVEWITDKTKLLPLLTGTK